MLTYKEVVNSFGDEPVSVYTLQNTKFGSADRLAAVVQFVYVDGGIQALTTAEIEAAIAAAQA